MPDQYLKPHITLSTASKSIDFKSEEGQALSLAYAFRKNEQYEQALEQYDVVLRSRDCRDDATAGKNTPRSAAFLQASMLKVIDSLASGVTCPA